MVKQGLKYINHSEWNLHVKVVNDCVVMYELHTQEGECVLMIFFEIL